MNTVVVAGSETSSKFAVIDFTNPQNALVALLDPGFGGGTRVNIEGAGSIAAVGGVLTGDVGVVDVSNPAAPVLQGSVNTKIAGVGAIAIRKNYVAVGESQNAFQASVILVDISAPMNPIPVAKAVTPFAANPGPAISSLAFLSDNVVVASSTNDPEIALIDFSNLGKPIVSVFQSGLAGTQVDCDTTLGRIVAGESSSGIVKLFDAINQATLQNLNTMLAGVNSIALSGSVAQGSAALVGSLGQGQAVLIKFGKMPPFVSFNPPLGGGVQTAINGNLGACADAVNGTFVALFDLTPNPPNAPTLLGKKIDASIGVVSTLAISQFVPPMGPAVVLSSQSLSFGNVRVNTTNQLQLIIQNKGGKLLDVTNIQSSSPRFTVNPLGPLSIAPNGSATLFVGFLPNAEAPFTGNLSFNTNDPNHPNLIVLLSGTGAFPHMDLSTTTLDFGQVPICVSGNQTLIIKNSGGVDLNITSITSSGPPFTVLPANAVIGPTGSKSATVTFTPSALGLGKGTLTILSDDPVNPKMIVTMSGTGLQTPPPAIAVSPLMLNFGSTPEQFYVGLRLAITNTSPCLDLQVALSTGGAPFFVTDVDPTTLPPMIQTVNGVVAGNGSKRFVVVFAPKSIGAATGKLTIKSNDPNNPVVTVNLDGNGVQLNPASVELVLDRSGSMSGAAPGGTKMEGLKNAVSLFVDLLVPGQGDEAGAVEFDDQANVLTQFGVLDVNQQTAIVTGAKALTPRNATSIGGGLQLGEAQLGGAKAPRKIMLIFTDGMENTPPSVSAVEPGILATSIEIYAIGLGQPQNISTAALSALAASAGGKFFQTDDTLILRKNFVQVLADAFRQNMSADPIIVLTPGQAVSVPIWITGCDRRVGFAVNWDNPATQLSFEIEAPDGMRFDQNSPSSNQLVTYGDRPGYKFYEIALPPIDPGSGAAIGPQRVGQWKMHIRPLNLVGTSERCVTSVFVESDLTMRIHLASSDQYSPITVNAILEEGGRPLTNAEVSLTVYSPTKSLAKMMTPAVVQRALQADLHPIPTNRKPKIPMVRKKYKLSLREDMFTVRVPVPKIDGVYQFEVQAIGAGCGGTFQRYESLSKFVGGKVDPLRSLVSATKTGPTAARITIAFRDKRGNPLVPGSIPVRTSMKGGVLRRPFMKTNGTFECEAFWSRRTHKPAVTIDVGGVKLRIRIPPGPRE